jgi:arylsulfatase A-like enzyme
VRHDCDREYLRRASAFIRAKAGQRVPFFVYFNHSLMHMPVIPREEFKVQTGQGNWVDSLLELDTDFGTLLDLLDELGVADDTMVVFAGDNGPEEVLLWRGTPGYWEGFYFAGGEGNLRTPVHGSRDVRGQVAQFQTRVDHPDALQPAPRRVPGQRQARATGTSGRAPGLPPSESGLSSTRRSVLAGYPASPVIASPISLAAMTRHRTDMMTAL